MDEMATRPSQRAAADRWDARNDMVFQTVKVRRQLRDDFKAACAANGERVNTVLRGAMENYVAEHGKQCDEQLEQTDDEI